MSLSIKPAHHFQSVFDRSQLTWLDSMLPTTTTLGLSNGDKPVTEDASLLTPISCTVIFGKSNCAPISSLR